ncbi:MAG: pyridoxal phosphate-dependent aminotransferase [Chloroflexi bacterium]|nr:pyridoxal phosphate-dependent aminotransferase [Chloroflexota bacterium]
MNAATNNLTASKIADRIAGVPPSGVAEMMHMGADLLKRGIPVTYLVQGEPDFATPAHIVAAGQEALARGDTHYIVGEGLLELREAVADKVRTENKIAVDLKKEVLVTTGATLGLYAALMAVVNPGDEVLLVDPGYGPYEAMTRLAGGIPVMVPLVRDARRYALDPDALKARLSPRTKAIVINSPHNPTGTVFSRAELEQIASVCVAHDLLIITDEVYEKLVFDGAEHISIATLGDEVKGRTITVNSFSKTYAMTGWRLGYNLAPAPLTQAMTKVIYQSGRCAPGFTQRAGVTALRGPQDCVTQMIGEYAERRLLMSDRLNRIEGVHFTPPQGSFYCFVDLSRFSGDSWKLAQDLLTSAHVVMSPGRYYGLQGEGHLRLSFACSQENIRTGLDAIQAFLLNSISHH